LHNMASDAARHRLASPRLTNFDSVALSCTRVRREASPRLASRMCECPFSLETIIKLKFKIIWF